MASPWSSLLIPIINAGKSDDHVVLEGDIPRFGLSNAILSRQKPPLKEI